MFRLQQHASTQSSISEVVWVRFMNEQHVNCGNQAFGRVGTTADLDCENSKAQKKKKKEEEEKRKKKKGSVAVERLIAPGALVTRM